MSRPDPHQAFIVQEGGYVRSESSLQISLTPRSNIDGLSPPQRLLSSTRRLSTSSSSPMPEKGGETPAIDEDIRRGMNGREIVRSAICGKFTTDSVQCHKVQGLQVGFRLLSPVKLSRKLSFRMLSNTCTIWDSRGHQNASFQMYSPRYCRIILSYIRLPTKYLYKFSQS